jgi:hypothetical protein
MTVPYDPGAVAEYDACIASSKATVPQNAPLGHAGPPAGAGDAAVLCSPFGTGADAVARRLGRAVERARRRPPCELGRSGGDVGRDGAACGDRRAERHALDVVLGADGPPTGGRGRLHVGRERAVDRIRAGDGRAAIATNTTMLSHAVTAPVVVIVAVVPDAAAWPRSCTSAMAAAAGEANTSAA